MSMWLVLIGIGLLLSYALLGKNIEHQTKELFDIYCTQAIRGFWCVIIVLVHIPEVYHNSI